MPNAVVRMKDYTYVFCNAGIRYKNNVNFSYTRESDDPKSLWVKKKEWRSGNEDFEELMSTSRDSDNFSLNVVEKSDSYYEYEFGIGTGRGKLSMLEPEIRSLDTFTNDKSFATLEYENPSEIQIVDDEDGTKVNVRENSITVELNGPNELFDTSKYRIKWSIENSDGSLHIGISGSSTGSKCRIAVADPQNGDLDRLVVTVGKRIRPKYSIGSTGKFIVDDSGNKVSSYIPTNFYSHYTWDTQKIEVIPNSGQQLRYWKNMTSKKLFRSTKYIDISGAYPVLKPVPAYGEDFFNDPYYEANSDGYIELKAYLSPLLNVNVASGNDAAGSVSAKSLFWMDSNVAGSNLSIPRIENVRLTATPNADSPYVKNTFKEWEYINDKDNSGYKVNDYLEHDQFDLQIRGDVDAKALFDSEYKVFLNPSVEKWRKYVTYKGSEFQDNFYRKGAALTITLNRNAMNADNVSSSGWNINVGGKSQPQDDPAQVESIVIDSLKDYIQFNPRIRNRLKFTVKIDEDAKDNGCVVNPLTYQWEAGKDYIYMPSSKTLTLTAVASDGYRFKKWSLYKDDQDNKSFIKDVTNPDLSYGTSTADSGGYLVKALFEKINTVTVDSVFGVITNPSGGSVTGVDDDEIFKVNSINVTDENKGFKNWKVIGEFELAGGTSVYDENIELKPLEDIRIAAFKSQVQLFNKI
jgi:hypothetical protein